MEKGRKSSERRRRNPENAARKRRRSAETEREKATIDSKRKETRKRLRLGGLLSAAAIVAGGVLYVSGKSDEMVTKPVSTETATQSTDEKRDQVLDLDTYKRQPPKITVSEEDIEFIPHLFVPDIEPEKMREISEKLAEYLRSYYLENVVPKIKNHAGDFKITDKVTEDLIAKSLIFLNKQDPRIKQYLDKHGRELNAHSFDAIMIFINNFLLQGDLSLIEHRHGGFFNLAPVKGFKRRSLESSS